MNRRPWPIVILAFIHFCAPIGNIFLNAILAGSDLYPYFMKALSYDYLVVNGVLVVAPIVGGVAIYACKKWSLYLYFATILSVAIFSYSSYVEKMNSVSLAALLFVYFVNAVVVSYFLIPAVRSIYFDRRLRWWEVQPRYKCHFSCDWGFKSGHLNRKGQISNISEDGLFLKSKASAQDKDKIYLTLHTSAHSRLSITAHVVVHDSVEIVGFGVKFHHSGESRKRFKALIRDLEAAGMRISSKGARPEDRLTYWIRTLFKSGQGLVPHKVSKKKAS